MQKTGDQQEEHIFYSHEEQWEEFVFYSYKLHENQINQYTLFIFCNTEVLQTRNKRTIVV